ncbi:tyrosine-type recombinase/integrase [Chloroflexota bacterium]
MRGSIFKQKNQAAGSWTIVIPLGLDPVTGKRRQRWFTIRGSKHDAERRLRELLTEFEQGTLVKPSKLTLGQYFLRWLEDYVWPNLAPRTAEGYEHIINKYLIPNLGQLPLTGLKPEHLQKYYGDRLAHGLSPRTVRHHHVTLRGALQMAVKREILARNPADATDPPRFARPEMHIIGEDDIEKLLQATEQTEYFPLIFLALSTGLRRSELLGLRWCDVDLLLCQAHITRSLHRLRTGETVCRPTKTAKSRRSVALSPATVQVLREYKEKQESEMLHAGKLLQEDTLLFPWPPDTVTHAWVKLARRIGLKGVRFHDLRHSHASLLLRQNVHPAIVQQRLGHASISTTIDVYSHIMPGLQAAAANGFDEFVRPRNRVSFTL